MLHRLIWCEKLSYYLITTFTFRLIVGFGDVNVAIAYIAKCKQLQPDDLTIPSQRRYASYFKNMLDGVRPSQTPLMLKRIIMSEAPKVSSLHPFRSLKLYDNF